MTGEIMKITKFPSKFGGWCYWIFFKCDDGKSYRMPTASAYRNFKKYWKPFCEAPEQAVGVTVEGLRIVDTDILDADYFTKSRVPHAAAQGGNNE